MTIRGLIKTAAKFAAWVSLISFGLFLVWGNLAVWGMIISPKGSVILIGTIVVIAFLIARLLTDGKFRITIGASRHRIATLGAAYIFDAIFNWLFNNPLYVYVIYEKGIVSGGIFLIIASFAICLIYLGIYDGFKKDFFGLEEMKKERYRGRMKWLFRKLNGRHKILTFVLLALVKDSFYATMFWRKPEHKYKGLTPGGWGILVLAILIENIPWIFTVAGGIWIWGFDIGAAWLTYLENPFFQLISWI